MLVAGLFLGPTLSILGEVQKVQKQDHAMKETEGTHRLSVLQRLLNAAGTFASSAEENLMQGKLPMVPFSALVSEGRLSNDETADLLHSASQKPDAHATDDVRFNFLRDVWWQARALCKMARSPVGFLTMPIFLSTVVFLMFTSMGQAANYLCSEPALQELQIASETERALNFKPWVRKYSVDLDRSFKDAFLAASAEESTTKRLWVDDSPKGNISAVLERVELLSRPLPHTNQVNVDGLHSSVVYGVLFSPLATLADSVTISGRDFERDIPWSLIPGSVTSVPHSEALTITVSLTDYKVDLPQPCHPSGCFANTFTSFCKYEDHRLGTQDVVPECLGNHSCQQFCEDHCRHDVQCLLAMPASTGCYRAMRPTNSTCGEATRTRRWLQREISGKLCQIGQGFNCTNHVDTMNYALRFEDVQLDWIEKHAELQVALALAVGEQQFDSDIESLHFRLGSPQVIDALVKFIGWSGGKEVVLKATSSVMETGDVEVMLWPYVPMELDELVLYVAPLLADPHFDSVWETAPLTNATLHFEQCDNSSFLQARFRLCGSLNGLSARVASISLDVWHPDDSQSSFFIVPRNEQDMEAFGRKQQKLYILLKDADEVAEWAVPTVRPSWWDEMRTDIPWQCNFPSNRERLWQSDRAACMYLKRGCSQVETIGPHYNFSISPTVSYRKPWDPVRVSQFVLCARESKEPPWWALSSAWRQCQESITVTHPPDLLCLQTPPNADAASIHGGFHITWFIKKLGGSSASEAVVEEGCAMLMKFTEGEKKKKLESDLFLSAVDTERVSSVNFVLNHCVNLSNWTLGRKTGLGKAVWKKLAPSSWASDLLSAFLSTSLAEGMMLAVIQEACFECVGLLQSWATKNPPKSASWIGWSVTELYLGLSSGGQHGITSFLEVLAQWLQLPFVLFGITSLEKVGEETSGGSSDTAVARFIPPLAHAGKNLTKVDLAYVFWDVKFGSSLRPLGEQMPLLEEISFDPGGVPWYPYLSADAVNALFLDGAGNFRFPKLQKVRSVHLLNDEAAVAWAKHVQIHKILSVELRIEKVMDVGRAALKPPPSDAEIRNVCKVNASRSDSEQLALESNLLNIALDRGFLATMRSVLDNCISFAKWNYTARLSILGNSISSYSYGIDYSEYLPKSWPHLLHSKTSDEKLSLMLNTSFAQCLVVTAAENSCEKCVGLLQSWTAKNKPKGSWIDWSGTELELALKASEYGHMPHAVSLLEILSQWLQLPFILSGIKSLEVGLPAEAEGMTEFKSELMRDEVRLPRAKFVQSLTNAGQNLTALKIANFLVVLNNASALRLLGPLPLLQTMLLAAGEGYWRVSMSADAVKALFLDDVGNFKFPKLQDLSIELLDDRAAVELSTVMQGRNMKALRVPKLSNLTDVGWATVKSKAFLELEIIVCQFEGQVGLLSLEVWSDGLRPEVGYISDVAEVQEECGGRYCAAAEKMGEFTMNPPPDFMVPVGLDRFVIRSSNCGNDASKEVEADVVMWLDPKEPVTNSTVHIFLKPLEADRLSKKNSPVVCAEGRESQASCICSLVLPPWTWSPVALLRRPLKWSSATGTVDAKLLDLHLTCPGLLDSFLCLAFPCFLLLMLSMIHAAYGIAKALRLLPRTVIPDPAMDLKSGAMQALKLSTLMVSLQAVLLDQEGVLVVCLVVLWPCLFGLAGICRVFQSMCQLQLSHAALRKGVCLTKPSNGAWSDYYMGVGMMILVISVAFALASLHFWKLLMLVAGLFLGPTLSILGEVQKVQKQDHAMRETEGTHQSDARVQGKLPMVPFSALVSEGRLSNDETTDLLHSASQKPDAHATDDVRFNFLRDVWWQARALCKMARSPVGFLTMPIFLSTVVFLMFTSMGQAANYLCSEPELQDLQIASETERALNFKPWVRKYSVDLDRSFKDAFLAASAEESTTKRLWVDDSPKGNISAVLERVELLSRPLPHTNQVNVDGLHSSVGYGILFSPLATLADSVTITGSAFERDLPWSLIPGSVISVPRSETLTITVSLTDYKVDLPQPCHPSGCFANTFTSFCKYEDHRLGTQDVVPECLGNHSCQQFCEDHCRHDVQCLLAMPASTGCYRAMRPTNSSCGGSASRMRRWLQREISGKLCQIGQGFNCINHVDTMNYALRFEDVQLDWIEKHAELQVALALAVGEQQLDSDIESLRFRLGSPQVIDALVKFIGRSGGKEVVLKATSSVTETGDVEVMLWPYVPMELDELVLYVAPLLADPRFDSAWETAPLTNETLQFEQCDNSSFLQARFQLCGSLNGLSATVASISLDVWHPQDSQSSFFIVPRNEQDMNAFGRKQQKLYILLKDADEAAEWAVPTVRPSWWDEMRTHIPWQCHFPSNEERLWQSDRAACMYLKRGCSEVEMIGPHYNSSSSTVSFHRDWDPVRTSQFILCGREAKEPPQWALSRAWSKCEEDIRHPPDLLCASDLAGEIKFQITWFIGKLGKESSTAAAAVVAEGCAMLMKLTEEGEKKKELESVFILGAVDTEPAPSVNFVLSHCVDFSKWTLDRKAYLGRVVWKKLAASSWAIDVLSALLSTSLAEGMMLAVVKEACFECVGLLQSWATKNPPKSPSWIGWSETELRLGLASEGGHGSTSFLEVLAQWLRLPFVLFGVTSLEVGYGTAGGSSDTAVARFISALAHAGKNLTKMNLAYVFWDVKFGSSLRPLGEQMPLLEEISFRPRYASWDPYLSADAVNALFLDGAGNFRFPKLQNVQYVHLLNDEAAVAWAKIEQIHNVKSKALLEVEIIFCHLKDKLGCYPWGG
eukprot:symbB.v1.2.009088.t1/scaffold570.1/size221114/3